MSISFDRYAWSSGQAKIGNFKNVIFGNQKVLGFEVPMKYFFLMAMIDSLKELVTEALW